MKNVSMVCSFSSSSYTVSSILLWFQITKNLLSRLAHLTNASVRPSLPLLPSTVAERARGEAERRQVAVCVFYFASVTFLFLVLMLFFHDICFFQAAAHEQNRHSSIKLLNIRIEWCALCMFRFEICPKSDKEISPVFVFKDIVSSVMQKVKERSHNGKPVSHNGLSLFAFSAAK